MKLLVQVAAAFASIGSVDSLHLQKPPKAPSSSNHPHQRKLEKQPAQKRAAIPNVILILADQHRYDWTAFDMPGLHTPTFKAVAKSGVRFSRATVPSPLCAPSRASLATGRRYGNTGVNWNLHDLPTSTATFYKVLQDSGVHTMTAGKDDLTQRSCPGPDGSFNARKLGFSSWLRCGGKMQVRHACKLQESYSMWLSVRHPEVLKDFLLPSSCKGVDRGGKAIPGDYLCQSAQIPQEAYMDNWVADGAVSLIRAAPKDKPFFLQVNYPGPHPPTQVTQNMAAYFESGQRPDILPLALGASTLPPEDQKEIRRRYATEIENIDRQNAKILATLQGMGVENNTVICITSDHGEQLGDFWDSAQKGHAWGKMSPWQGSVNVPLACKGPGINKGLVVDSPVSTLDLTATILEIMGANSTDSDMDSESLMPFMTGGTPPKRAVTSGLENGLALRIATVTMSLPGAVWKLMACLGECPYGKEPPIKKVGSSWDVKLFNLDKDPQEQNDMLVNATPRFVTLALHLTDSLQYPANITAVRKALLIGHSPPIVQRAASIAHDFLDSVRNSSSDLAFPLEVAGAAVHDPSTTSAAQLGLLAGAAVQSRVAAESGDADSQESNVGSVIAETAQRFLGDDSLKVADADDTDQEPLSTAAVLKYAKQVGV